MYKNEGTEFSEGLFNTHDSFSIAELASQIIVFFHPLLSFLVSISQAFLWPLNAGFLLEYTKSSLFNQLVSVVVLLSSH